MVFVLGSPPSLPFFNNGARRLAQKLELPAADEPGHNEVAVGVEEVDLMVG
jgi:hypothetical protein